MSISAPTAFRGEISSEPLVEFIFSVQLLRTKLAGRLGGGAVTVIK
jgi:hypothetical protein